MFGSTITRTAGLAAIALAAAATPAMAQTVDRTYAGTCTAAVLGEAGSERTALASFHVRVSAPDLVATNEEFRLTNLSVQTTTTALRQVLAGRDIAAIRGGTRAFAAIEGGEPYSSGNISDSGEREISDATIDQLITMPGTGTGTYDIRPFWGWLSRPTTGDTRITFRGVTAVYSPSPATPTPSTVINVDCRIPEAAAETLVLVKTRADLPRVTSIAPARGLALIPQVVTITGEHLRGVRRVAFGRAGTSSAFIVDSPTRIRVLTPPLPPGRWPVSVQIAGYDSVGTTVMPGYIEIVPWA